MFIHAGGEDLKMEDPIDSKGLSSVTQPFSTTEDIPEEDDYDAE